MPVLFPLSPYVSHTVLGICSHLQSSSLSVLESVLELTL